MSEENILDLFDSSGETIEAESGNQEAETVETAEDLSAENEAPEVESQKKEVTTTLEEEIEKNQWTFQAVKDERKKRQAAEARIKELEDQMNGSADKKMPDVFEDQEAFVNALKSELNETRTRDRIELYREIQAEQYPDYIEKEQAFIELAKQNPILITQMNQAKNPARFVYEQMVKLEEFEKSKNIDSYREKLKAELMAEVKAELSAKGQLPSGDIELSPSLARARGSTDKHERASVNPIDLFN